MRTARLTLALTLAAAACSRGGNGGDRAQQRLDEVSDAYDVTEADVVLMRRLATEINELAIQTRGLLANASERFQAAARMYDNASADYMHAAEEYRAAEARYRQVVCTIILAAGSDLFLRGVCGPSVSTHEYRQQLRAQGVDLKGIDIDHIVARARGGPDRPWNYQPLESSINRSLGAGGLLWKLSNSPLATLDALAKNASYMLLCAH